jgi:hypothetical protein
LWACLKTVVVLPVLLWDAASINVDSITLRRRAQRVTSLFTTTTTALSTSRLYTLGFIRFYDYPQTDLPLRRVVALSGCCLYGS